MGDATAKLTVRETLDEDIVVENLTRKKVECAEDADQILRAASRNRHTAATNSNKTSSRSPSLFALRITGTNGIETREGFEPRGSGWLRTVTCVRVGRGPAIAARGEIHQLFSLNSGDGRGRFSEENKTHVPYRDSRLTFLLRPSLCGDAKCLAIFNLAPEKAHLRESLSTLRFGQKVTECAPSAKCVKCGHPLK